MSSIGPGLPWPKKYLVVDQHGTVVGTEQIRDPSLVEELNADPRHKVHFEGMRPQGVLRYVEATPANIVIYKPQGVGTKKAQWLGSEVKTLYGQGDSENRIDLTIVGDGYTPAEKEKFFRDAQAAADELFQDQTFATYLPLFNVHAVFVPSNESGIGNGRPQDTALGLYRHPQHRQAVMPGNPSAARRAAALAPDVDYPILLANDDLYGGLGGEFAITTSSQQHLTTVLRHELGHNFGRVGEEYDGGFVYSGANSSRSPDAPWKHWSDGETTAFQQQLLHYSSPWKNLAGADWEKAIQVSEGTDRVVINFNSTGFDTSDDVALYVDGEEVPYEGTFSKDRNFYEVILPLAPGEHTVRFQQKVADGNNVISKVSIYALPADYPKKSDKVEAFATFNSEGRVAGYRPTEAACLMRTMSSREFCPVCVENMWEKFLKQVSLIDRLEQTSQGEGEVELDTIDLGERIKIEWIDPTGEVRAELTDGDPAEADAGDWTCRVTFISDEVRKPGHESWTVHEAQVRVEARRS